MGVIESAPVVGRDEVAPGCVRLVIEAPRVAALARPGQFLHVRCGRGRDPLLRRPLSVHDADPRAGTVALLVQVVGRGTTLLAAVRRGEAIDVMGPLGRGFESAAGGELLLVAGGAGVAPLLFAARACAGRPVRALVGARTAAALIAVEELEKWGAAVEVATDDGAAGRRGPVTEILEQRLTGRTGWATGRTGAAAAMAPSEVWACGPVPMLRQAAALAAAAGVRCLVSLEARMACGVGACRGCAWPAAATAPAPRGYVRVCRDGPVFDAREVAL